MTIKKDPSQEELARFEDGMKEYIANTVRSMNRPLGLILLRHVRHVELKWQNRAFATMSPEAESYRHQIIEEIRLFKDIIIDNIGE